jgi:hypothetical protein
MASRGAPYHISIKIQNEAHAVKLAADLDQSEGIDHVFLRSIQGSSLKKYLHWTSFPGNLAYLCS